MMRAFTRETSTAIAIPGVNCDTDQIIPGRFLKADRAQGYGQFLFHDIRRDEHGEIDPAFPLNKPGADAATILLVEDNFGCGSSREGAVYAPVDHGIRALIGPSFGDIFFNNALKNGLVPVRLAAEHCEALADYLARCPDAEVTVDLEAAELVLPGNLGIHPIAIDPFARDCILRGLDEIEMTFTFMEQITAFETDRMASHSWLSR
ncbi:MULTISPECIES: 3-isopropylmalate dehydratase small subunit [unclassified Rhizobium]|uniref:3-isopropylmalate dehydratase small subunit n=1 Tax=unclassified Rhizobium TaxID=2613769 RepID=UPI00177EEA8F|nr:MULTISPECIES: 3-isopropylmalate dehydratase small subunit [unclassified Rhizobium]MBD8688179.1 3-isopropylmalate dehydratase small subunit [Rhizobium sp. CFBP 13644]MBD8692634.1 3-isopropylmalate dehydratase small subunit [Rhizobium sp. CFBP 13717]